MGSEFVVTCGLTRIPNFIVVETFHSVTDVLHTADSIALVLKAAKQLVEGGFGRLFRVG